MDEIIGKVGDFKHWVNKNTAELILDNMPLTGETWLNLAKARCDYIQNPVFNLITGGNDSSCDGIDEALHGLPENLQANTNFPQR